MIWEYGKPPEVVVELVGQGRSLGEVVRMLARARDLAPQGRHKLVLTPSGGPALQWPDGLTSLDGQGLLPLDEDHATLDDLFEAAALAEAGGQLDEAEKLYRKALVLSPGDSEPYNGLALVAFITTMLLGARPLAQQTGPVARNQCRPSRLNRGGR